MSDHPKPTSGNESGPCAVCGSYAYPKFGYFLCPDHATLKHAQKLESE